MAGLAGRKKSLATVLQEKARLMKYNPLRVKNQGTNSPIDAYPNLRKLENFRLFIQGGSTVEQKDFRYRASWYVVWLYSLDSVLNTKPPESLVDRKLKALNLAGFKPLKGSGEFSYKIVRELMHLGDSDFVLAILDYLRHQRDALWTEIMVTEEQYFEAVRLRLEPVEKGDLKSAEFKRKLRMESKELKHDIKLFWDEFWADHDDLRDEGQEIMYQSLEDRARVNVGDEG